MISVALVIILSASAALGQGRCETIWPRSGVVSTDLIQMIDSLIQLQEEAADIPDSKLQSMTLMDLKKKSREIQEVLGSSFRSIYEERRKSRIQLGKDVSERTAEKDLRKKARDQIQDLVRGTHWTEHRDIRKGLFLDETTLVFREQDFLSIYETQSRQILSREKLPADFAGLESVLVKSVEADEFFLIAPDRIGRKNLKSGTWEWRTLDLVPEGVSFHAKASKKGDFIYIANREGVIRIVETRNLDLIFSHRTVSDIDFQKIVESPEGRHVFFPGARSWLLYDLKKKEMVPVTAAINPMTSAVFLNESTLLLADRTQVKEFHIPDREFRANSLRLRQGGELFMSPDQKYLVVVSMEASGDRNLPPRIIDLQTKWDVTPNLSAFRFQDLHEFQMSADQPVFVMVDDTSRRNDGRTEQSVYRFDLKNQVVESFVTPADRELAGFAQISPTAQSLFFSGFGKLWEVR